MKTLNIFFFCTKRGNNFLQPRYAVTSYCPLVTPECDNSQPKFTKEVERCFSNESMLRCIADGHLTSCSRPVYWGPDFMIYVLLKLMNSMFLKCGIFPVDSMKCLT